MSFHDRDLALGRPQGLIRAEPRLVRPGPRLVREVVLVRDPEMMMPGLVAPALGGGTTGLPTIVETLEDYWDNTDPLWPASITQDGADGCLSVWFVFNGTSTTIPTVPGSLGWTSQGTKVGTSSAAVLATRIVSGSAQSIGSWTNGTIIIGSYYTGVSAVGAVAFSSSAATTSIAYPSLTLTYGGVGGSWIVTGGASNTKTTWLYRSGQTNQLNANFTSAGSAGIADTGARTTGNLTATNVTFGTTMSRVITFALELY